MYGWLDEHKLAHLATHFIDAELCTSEDLTLEPRLDIESLRAIGIEKAGEARKVLKLIAEL